MRNNVWDDPFRLKKRLWYAALVLITIGLGLSSRKFSHVLPSFIASHAGDMLWASMVYFGFRCLFVKKSLIWAAALSLIFSYAIEFSQMYQAEWLVDLRQTVIGSLVLGTGFLKVDLIRYALGIILAYCVDILWFKSREDSLA
ncbi:DUF2809 domain-containing protein [Paenibacillus alba]|uniref:ribosomal maturation YjgA family protein n=1 Tax=Paenibacillus alba TaxID=1197127 RepID=UPI001566C9ED|nr:DUF2809 domain-containing protein [Paenibacillus alba]NQX70264.1 DUF2809 domain-containing protein [Paenibacillus alba]